MIVTRETVVLQCMSSHRSVSLIYLLVIRDDHCIISCMIAYTRTNNCHVVTDHHHTLPVIILACISALLLTLL